MGFTLRYDDRLRTVLAQPDERPHDRAVRWRQLVELLARGGEAADPHLFDAAIEAARTGVASVDERVRTAAARSIAAFAVPPQLVSVFAADRLSVAAPVLAAARLTASEWAEVSARATPECRRFIASLRAEAGGAALGAQPDPPAAAVPAPQPDSEGTVPSISDVLARIERIRELREHPDSEPHAEEPSGPLEPPGLFRWECNEAGEIAWVEGVPRGALVGRSIARGVEPAEAGHRVERAFAQRMPFREARLELAEEGPLAGSWKVSGVPAFDPGSGRFAGYRGIAERDSAAGGPGLVFPIRDPDSLRELAHEIRTPLNAIIGFAEIISGEYLGPANENCRERAREIVAQARLLLTAVEDLDLAASLQSKTVEGAETSLAQVIESLAPELAERGGVFSFLASPTCTLDSALTERLLSRFCNAVLAAGENAPAAFLVDSDEDCCIVSVRKPPGMTEDEHGLGLGLRLVLGLARVAGGDLVAEGDTIKLLLPRA